MAPIILNISQQMGITPYGLMMAMKDRIKVGGLLDGSGVDYHHGGDVPVLATYATGRLIEPRENTGLLGKFAAHLIAQLEDSQAAFNMKSTWTASKGNSIRLSGVFCRIPAFNRACTSP